MKLLIKNGRVIDPSRDFDRVCDLLLADGVVAASEAGLRASEGTVVYDATAKWVMPGAVV